MNNSVLDFKIDFILNNSPKDLTFEDLTNYAAYGIALTKVTGNLKLTSPSSVFYINSGYAANDFSSPDIDADVSLLKTGINLPVATNGDVLCGNYKFEYSVKVDYAINVSSIVNNKFRTSLVGANTLLQVGNKIEVYDSTTGNNGIYTITGVTAATVNNTIISVAETIVGAFSAEKINIIYNTSKTVDYCFISPVVDIEVQSNCNTSILTSEDLTDYKVNGISPLITRTHTLIYPIDPSTGLPIDTSVTGSTAVLTAGANIYTGMWTINISSVLEYSLNTWLTVNTTVQGQTYYEVKCSLCMCLFFNCYKAVYEKYKSMLGYNAREVERLTGVLLRIVSLYQLYQLAVKCGYDTDYYCTEIKTILNTENCTCDTEANDDVPVEVIPISSGGGGTTVVGSVWYNGTGVPSPSLGSNGDYYLDNATGNVYYLTGGVWTITTNIFGSAGSNGSTILNGSGVPAPTLGTNGDYYIDTASNDLYNLISGTWTVIGNIQGATGATGQDGVSLWVNKDDGTNYSNTLTNAEEILTGYSLDPANYNDYDMIEVEVLVQITRASVANPIYYRVRFGGILGTVLNFPEYQATMPMKVLLRFDITLLKSISKAYMMSYHSVINNATYPNMQIPNITISREAVFYPSNLSIATDIVITSENLNTVPALYDVIVKHFRVKYFNELS